jgi:rod shape-determining protein MreC
VFRWLGLLWRRPDLSSILLTGLLSIGMILLPEQAKLELAQHTVPVLFFPFNRSVSFLTELARLQRENRELRYFVALSTTEAERLRAQEIENTFWRRVYGLQARGRFRLVACEVIAKAVGLATSTMILNRGTSAGLAKNQPVIAPEGLIGKVVSVGPSTAYVRTILDTTLHVGAMVSRTHRAGIMEWDRGTDHCLLTKIPATEDVQLGDAIITSGLGGVFPIGIPIGQVTKVGREPIGFFLDIEIAPFADLGKSTSALVVVGEDTTALPSTDSLVISVVRIKKDTLNSVPSRQRILRRDSLTGEGTERPGAKEAPGIGEVSPGERRNVSQGEKTP